ncbi:MAG: tetratricopeptide repeat protein [Pyrinomonadaceae bacterium]
MRTCEKAIKGSRLFLCIAVFGALSPALAQDIASRLQTDTVAQLIERVRSGSDERVFAKAADIGGALLREEKFAQAADLFSVLAEKQPNNSLVIYSAALAAFNSGRVPEAEQFARKALNVARIQNETNRLADALVLLSVVLAVRKDDAGSLDAAREAVQMAPASFDAQFTLGRALYGAGDDVGAVAAFRKAVALRTGDPQARFFLATALELSGNDDAALVTYKDLITQQPEYAQGHLGAGVLLAKKGRGSFNEAIAELMRALSINPKLYEARIALGRVLLSSGKVAEAVEHFRLATEIAPNNPEPHYQLSLAYRRLGRKQEANAEAAVVQRIHDARRRTKLPAVSPD